MKLISDAQLALGRKDMANLLTDTCEHFAKTKVVGDSGSSKSSWTTQGELPCMVYIASGGKTMQPETKLIAEGNADVADHIIRLPWDSVVATGDKLVVNEGDTFQVTSIGGDDTGRFLLQVGAQRIAANK